MSVSQCGFTIDTMISDYSTIVPSAITMLWQILAIALEETMLFLDTYGLVLV